MIKKQSVAALGVFLLIPLVVSMGGLLFSAVNPEIAAGHPNYVRNYHLLNLLRLSFFWGSFAVAAVLWFLMCALVIRSKKRSQWWLLLGVFGPPGLIVLAMLNDSAPAETERQTRSRIVKWLLRGAYEICTFVIVCVLAWEGMVLHRAISVRIEAIRTGVSVAQVIDIRNASGGMWAFSEGNEVLYLVVLFYLLRPVVLWTARLIAAKMATAKAG